MLCESWVCGSTPVTFVHPPRAPPLPGHCVCLPAHLCPPCSPLDIALCRRTRTPRVTIQRMRGTASAWLMPSPRSTPSPQSTPRDRRPLQQQMARSSRPSASSSRQRRRRPGSRGAAAAASGAVPAARAVVMIAALSLVSFLPACLFLFSSQSLKRPWQVADTQREGGRLHSVAGTLARARQRGGSRLQRSLSATPLVASHTHCRDMASCFCAGTPKQRAQDGEQRKANPKRGRRKGAGGKRKGMLSRLIEGESRCACSPAQGRRADPH